MDQNVDLVSHQMFRRVVMRQRGGDRIDLSLKLQKLRFHASAALSLFPLLTRTRTPCSPMPTQCPGRLNLKHIKVG